MDGDKVLDLTNTWCDDSFETVDTGASSDFRVFIPQKMSFSMKLGISAVKSLTKAAYGWKAKGPIRKKILHKLWGLK